MKTPIISITCVHLSVRLPVFLLGKPPDVTIRFSTKSHWGWWNSWASTVFPVTYKLRPWKV